MEPEAEDGFGLCICPLSLLIGRFSERPGAVQGARDVCGGGESIAGLKRFSAAKLWTARTVLKHGAEGKGGQAADALQNASGYNSGSNPLCFIAERRSSYRVEPFILRRTHEFCYRAVYFNDGKGNFGTIGCLSVPRKGSLFLLAKHGLEIRPELSG